MPRSLAIVAFLTLAGCYGDAVRYSQQSWFHHVGDVDEECVALCIAKSEVKAVNCSRAAFRICEDYCTYR